MTVTRVVTDPIVELLTGRASSMRQIQAVVTAVDTVNNMVDVQVPGIDAEGNQILAPIPNVRCFGAPPAVGQTTTLFDSGQGRLVSLGVAGSGDVVVTPPGGGGEGGTGTSRVLATWSALGFVWPHLTTIVPSDDAGQIAGVHVTVGLPPARQLVVDVQLAQPPDYVWASIFADPSQFPTFSSSQANPLLVVLATPATFAAESLFRAEWVDGGGAYDATIKVLG